MGRTIGEAGAEVQVEEGIAGIETGIKIDGVVGVAGAGA